MLTAVERRAHAERNVQAFLAGAQVQQLRLDEVRPGRWRCELRCLTHPGATDMQLDVAANGHTRGGALDLAHAELRGEVLRYYLDPDASAQDLNDKREALTYRPGPLGARRVLAALQHRRAGQLRLERVLDAGLHCTLTSGGTATVGDVVDYLLAGDTPQARLLM